MVRTVLTVAGVAVLLAALWAARGALVLVYVSALIAMGFSPLVRLIERPATRKRRRAMPRALAIFAVYLAIIAIFVVIGLLVIPPLVEQATTLWERLPQHFNDLQRVLVRYKLETTTVTLQEAVQNAPAGSGGNAVSTAWTAISSVVGGVFGLITIIILSFYLLIEGGIGDDVRDALHLARPARACDSGRARSGGQSERVAPRAADARRRDGHAGRRRPRPPPRSLLLRRRARRGRGRNDSHARSRDCRRDGRRDLAERVPQAGGNCGRPLPAVPSARSQHPRAENHGTARRRQPRRRDGGAAPGRLALWTRGGPSSLFQPAIISVLIEEFSSST